MLAEQQVEQLPREFTFRTSRSGGKGGQNVNKVESRVEVVFDVTASTILTEDQKARLIEKLGPEITSASDSHRTQLQNKKDALEKMFRMINNALKVKARRVATRPTRASREKKLSDKKRRGEIKSMRRRDF